MSAREEAELAVVSRPVPRADGRDKVTGRALYVPNLRVAGMLYAAVLRSPHPHARLLSVDASAAEALPGVVAVLTRADLEPDAGLVARPRFGAVYKDQPLVAIDRVRYAGDPVAAVAAESLDVAQEALDLIRVEYEPLPAVSDPIEAAKPGAPVIHPDLELPKIGMADVIGVLDPVPGTNILNRFELVMGDPEAGFAAADLVCEDSFSTPAVQHVPLEPHAVLADWQSGGRLTVWSATQTPYLVRGELAGVFGLPASDVRVVVPYLGGGFGGKCYPKIEPLTAALARKARRPVRLVLSREDEFLTITRHPYRVRVKTGVTRDGRIVAREMELYIDSGAYADITPRHIRWPGPTALGPYRIPNARVRSYGVYTNNVPTGAYRGYSVPKSAFAGEQQLDIVAARLGIDAGELRRKNLLRDGDTYVTGETMRHVGFAQSLDQALELAEWRERSEPRVEGRVAYGLGFAITPEVTVAPSTSAATVKLNEDGSLHVLSSTVEMGQGSSTVLAQIAAEELGVPYDRVRVVLPDTDVTPWDLTTSASRSTFMMGNAVRLATAEAKEQLLQLAGSMLESHPRDLEIRDGIVRRRGDPAHGVPIAAVMRGPGGRMGSIVGRGHFSPEAGLDKGGKGKASPFWSSATGVAEVAVDLDTGVVRVVRYTTVTHAGRIVNPDLSRGQSEGSIIMGVGHALFDHMIVRDHLPVNATLLEYHIPTILDIPQEFRVGRVDLPHPDGPFGAKGLGETDLSPAAAAVANAVARACGSRIFQLPLTPERVLAALTEAPTAGAAAT